MSFLSAAVSAVTSYASNKSELEKKLDEALSKENWGAPSTLLREIAAATFDPADYPVVMREVWESLNHAGKNWRQIFKGLTLLDTLVKHGSERVVDDARDHLFRIRTLTDFTHHADGGDKGAGVREKAKALVELLNDNLRIREEREQARRLRDKYVGISNVGAPASISLGGASAYRGDDSWERRRGGEFSSHSTAGGGSGGDRAADWRSSAESSSRGLRDVGEHSGAGRRPQQQQQRRGRRPAGGGDLGAEEEGPAVPSDATVAELPHAHAADFDAFGGASAGGADFDAFGPGKPAKPAPSMATAAPSASAGGGAVTGGGVGGSSSTSKFQVNIRPSTGVGAAPLLRPPPGAATASSVHVQAPAKPAPAPASSASDDFGRFSAAPPAPAAAASGDWSEFAAAPAAPAPKGSASGDFFDPFSGGAPAATPARPTAAAVLAAAYDPFSSPLPLSHPVATSTGGGGVDPFAGTPGMNLAAAAAATGAASHGGPAARQASAAAGADDFGGFASAAVKDDDVDRLFLAGGPSLGTKAASTGSAATATASGSSSSVPLAPKKALPLNALGHAAPKAAAAPAMLAPAPPAPVMLQGVPHPGMPAYGGGATGAWPGSGAGFGIPLGGSAPGGYIGAPGGGGGMLAAPQPFGGGGWAPQQHPGAHPPAMIGFPPQGYPQMQARGFPQQGMGFPQQQPQAGYGGFPY